MMRFFGKLLLSILSVVIFFGIFEAVLRISGFQEPIKDKKKLERLFMMGQPLSPVDPVANGPYDRDQLFFWKLRPRKSDDVNEKGYRGPLRGYDKPQGVYRVIILGDSCAYGILVPYKGTYAALLEEKLNEMSPGRFEVINGGVPGYSSLQGLRYLEHELIRYHPDMVLVGFGFNDLCEAVYEHDKDVDGKRLPQWAVQLDNAAGNMRFYAFMRQLFAEAKEKVYVDRLKSADAKRAFPVLFLNPWMIGEIETLIKVQSQRGWLLRVPPADFSANINAIVDFGKKEGFRTVLLTLPSVDGSFGYGQLLRLMARDRGADLIDLAAIVKRKKGNDAEDYFIDMNHYNRKGHQLVADIIYDAIKSMVPKREGMS